MIINETENCIREDTRNPRRSRRGRGQKMNRKLFVTTVLPYSIPYWAYYGIYTS